MRENVELPRRLDGGAPTPGGRRAALLLDRVGLAGGARARTRTSSRAARCSGSPSPGRSGTGARLLLADEPTGNLDSRTGTQVLDLISGLVASHGITVVMATHSAGAAARASRVLNLLDGRLVP